MTWVVGLIIPIWPALSSVNQRLPSGPVVIPYGGLRPWGTGNSVMAWVVGLIIPICSARTAGSVNQRLPSGPAVIPKGPEAGRGDGELGDGVGRRVDHPDLSTAYSVNQRLPSGPAVIPRPEVAARRGRGGSELGDDAGRRVDHPDLVSSVNQRLPSGPRRDLAGELIAVGMENSVMVTPESNRRAQGLEFRPPGTLRSPERTRPDGIGGLSLARIHRVLPCLATMSRGAIGRRDAAAHRPDPAAALAGIASLVQTGLTAESEQGIGFFANSWFPGGDPGYKGERARLGVACATPLADPE